MAVNGDTFMHDMMELAGFENVCGARLDRYPRIEKEELQSARRELALEAILLPNEPFEFVPQHATEIAALAGLPHNAPSSATANSFVVWVAHAAGHRGDAQGRRAGPRLRAARIGVR